MKRVRVLHLPARAPYARHLVSDGIEIVNAQDNTPPIPRDTTFGWLKNFLEANPDNYNAFDVLHVHTVELTDINTFQEVIEGCVHNNKGLLFTFHDTRPMFSKDIENYNRSLKMIVSTNAVLATLTESARQALSDITNVSMDKIYVIPHGNVLSLDSDLWNRKKPPKESNTNFSIHGGFRPNKSLFPAVLNFAFGMPETEKLKILTRGIGNKEYFENSDVRETLRIASTAKNIHVQFHPFPSDEEIADFVFNSDYAVLPYLWGAHSGQLELAFDLGVSVVATNVGFYEDQCKALKGYVPPPILVDWSDGNEYQYGSRILSGMLVAANGNHKFSPEQRKDFSKFRRSERGQILEKYEILYHEALNRFKLKIQPTPIPEP